MEIDFLRRTLESLLEENEDVRAQRASVRGRSRGAWQVFAARACAWLTCSARASRTGFGPTRPAHSSCRSCRR